MVLKNRSNQIRSNEICIRQELPVPSIEMSYYIMIFYQTGWFSSIFHLHSLVIAKSNFWKSADLFTVEIDH